MSAEWLFFPSMELTWLSFMPLTSLIGDRSSYGIDTMMKRSFGRSWRPTCRNSLHITYPCNQGPYGGHHLRADCMCIGSPGNSRK